MSDQVDDPLQGYHYYLESRLTQAWSVNKVWETIGVFPGLIDASEHNLGTLSAALTNAGVAQIYPANCFGDSVGRKMPPSSVTVSVSGIVSAKTVFFGWLANGSFLPTISRAGASTSGKVSSMR